MEEAEVRRERTSEAPERRYRGSEEANATNRVGVIWGSRLVGPPFPRATSVVKRESLRPFNGFGYRWVTAGLAPGRHIA